MDLIGMEMDPLDSSISGQRPMVGSCEYRIEPLPSIQSWEILEWLVKQILASQEGISFMELVCYLLTQLI
jgi:hypothetical protein